MHIVGVSVITTSLSECHYFFFSRLTFSRTMRPLFSHFPLSSLRDLETPAFDIFSGLVSVTQSIQGQCYTAFAGPS